MVDEAEADLPEDFFNDLADDAFVETQTKDPTGSDEDEQMARCLSEIEKLQKDIERRKRKILEREAGLSESEKNRKRSRRSRSRSKSDTRKDRIGGGERGGKDNKDRKRYRRSRSRDSSPSFSSSSKTSIKHRSRYDEKDRRNRTRSRSPMNARIKRSSSTQRGLTFLEELEKTFAEKGQAFPEKDLLMQQKGLASSANSMVGHSNRNEPTNIGAPMGMDYGNPMNVYNQGPPQPMYQAPLVSYPIQQQNPYYGINPMAVMVNNGPPIPAQFPVGNAPIDPQFNQNAQMIHSSDEHLLASNQNALIERCEQAIKLIRAKDNKVPVLKFQFNRTSTVVTNSNNSNVKTHTKSPLQIHSTLNAPFKLNALPNVRIDRVNGIRMLPKRVKNVCQALGINSAIMFEKLRTKELSNQITDEIIKCEQDVVESSDYHQINRDESTVSSHRNVHQMVETSEISTQTAKYECKACTERQKRLMVNIHTQTFPKTHSLGIQTDEKDYREPIVKQLSRMTAAQLVAIRDFADIITEPKPQSAVELFRFRERLMDIYNLSQRDADAVRAEEMRMAEEQRRLAEEQQQQQQRFGDDVSSMRSRSSNGMFVDLGPISPSMRNGPGVGKFGLCNFETNAMNDLRGGFMMDDRSNSSSNRRFSEERQFQNRMLIDDQRLFEENRMIEEQRRFEEQRMIEERERQRLQMIEMDRQQNEREFELRRQREIELLEIKEREQRMEREIRMRQMQESSQNQQQQQQTSFGMFDQQDRGGDFNRSGGGGGGGGSSVSNRRGRGAFRDQGWGRGGRR